MSRTPSVVVLGGGTGTFMMLLSLKRLPVHLTAILTMVDDGGSNKILRDQFGLLPTSGIRQAIVALSEDDSLMRELFNYRFSKGDGISGMTFGNLFMAAVTDIVGSQKKAIDETQRLLKVQGKILPISYDDVRLVAKYEDGREVVGEHFIDEPEKIGVRIVSVRTEPQAYLSPEAREAIVNADFVILGPGDFYTNTIANLVVDGVTEALAESKGQVLFIGNLMTKLSETPHYQVSDFLDEFEKYLGVAHLDHLVVNNNQEFPAELLSAYQEEQQEPVKDDLQGDQYQNVRVWRADLLSDEIVGKQAGDNLQRSVVRHDPEKFARFFAQNFLE